MRRLHSEIEIGAPPERVWGALTDFRSFPSWNPLFPKAKGKLVPGRRLKVQLRLGSRQVTFRPRVTQVRPPHELAWRARQWIPGLFEVDRRFTVEPMGRSGSRLVQSETATGVLAPVLMPLLRRRVMAGYRAFDVAIKDRVESADDAQPSPWGALGAALRRRGAPTRWLPDADRRRRG